MVMLGDGSDISVGVAVLAGVDGAWPQLGGWLEQRAAQVLQEPQAVGGHSQAAPARRVQDLDTAAVLPDPRAERRRRLAEPDLEFRAFCARKGLPASSTLQLERAWAAWQAERYQRGETGQRPGYTDNPFRPR
jgi:hypothetical protein